MTPDDLLAEVRGLAQELAPERDFSRLGSSAHLERDFGLGSLERVQLLQRLEARAGRRLPEREVFSAVSVGELEAVLGGRASEPPPELVVVRHPVPPLPGSATDLWEVLAYQASYDRPFLYLEARTVSFLELLRESERLAAALAAEGAGPGDRIATMLPTGLPMVALFFAILRLGAIPVPLYPPFRLDQLEEFLKRQAAILRNAEARLLVTFEEARPVAELLGWSVISVDALVGGPEAAPQPGEVALIQYTSGSTGQPKGVVLTHANLLANLRAYGQGMAIGPEDACVSWLPLYHDMGLIGSLLGSLYHGIPLVLMGPQDFLSRPSRWLQAISRHRGTISPAPNFAYEICARRIPDSELEGVDLSSWRVALNGAEAVRPDTMTRFCRRFAPYGFRPEAVFPAYGLAEASLGVTFPPPGRGMKVHQGLVSCGSALPGMEVRVVDGRIQFRGPSSLQGYYRLDQPVKDDEGWVETGDQGFLHEGELYVTGRLKDLILKAGRNLHPEDVEDLASSVEGIRRGCVAAFGVSSGEAGTEELWVLCETRSPSPALEEAVRERVLEGIGVPPDRVILALPGTVLKTPSGKIRRGACRELAQKGRVGRPRLGRMLALRLGLARLRSWSYAAWCWALVACAWVLVLVDRRLARPAVRVFLRLAGLRLRVLERPRVEGPCLLVANHSSLLDSLALLAAWNQPLRFVVADWVIRLPLMRPIAGRLGLLPVVRGQAARASAEADRLAAVLRAGDSLAGYPEGGLEISVGLRPFALGLFQAACQAGVPVVAVALRGTRRSLPWTRLVPRPGVLEVEFVGVLEPRGAEFEHALELSREARSRIAARCGEPLVSERLIRS